MMSSDHKFLPFNFMLLIFAIMLDKCFEYTCPDSHCGLQISMLLYSVWHLHALEEVE